MNFFIVHEAKYVVLPDPPQRDTVFFLLKRGIESFWKYQELYLHHTEML